VDAVHYIGRLQVTLASIGDVLIHMFEMNLNQLVILMVYFGAVCPTVYWSQDGISMIPMAYKLFSVKLVTGRNLSSTLWVWNKLPSPLYNRTQ